MHPGGGARFCGDLRLRCFAAYETEGWDEAYAYETCDAHGQRLERSCLQVLLNF